MSIRERLYPSPSSTPMLVKHCSDARFVYNLGLEQRNLWRPERTHRITYISQARELTEVRRAYPWLAEGSSVVQQGALRDLDKAFQNWWRNPNHFHYPTWRKAVLNEGFYIRDLSVRKINRKWGEVLVPKTGRVCFRLSRTWTEIEASTSARITLDHSGRSGTQASLSPNPCSNANQQVRQLAWTWE